MENRTVVFTPSPEVTTPFTSCVPIMAVEDEFIEADERVSVEIDPDSLMPNDRSVSPNEVEVTIMDNDGN